MSPNIGLFVRTFEIHRPAAERRDREAAPPAEPAARSITLDTSEVSAANEVSSLIR